MEPWMFLWGSHSEWAHGSVRSCFFITAHFSFIGTHFKRNLSRCIFVDTILDSKHLAAMLQKQGWKLSQEQVKYLSEYWFGVSLVSSHSNRISRSAVIPKTAAPIRNGGFLFDKFRFVSAITSIIHYNKTAAEKSTAVEVNRNLFVANS